MSVDNSRDVTVQGALDAHAAAARTFTPGDRRRARTAPMLVLASMASVQFGVALARTMFATLGVAGTTVMRLGWAALILCLATRPKLAGRPPRQLALALALVLGVASGGMTLLLAAATDRIPLALATTLDFLGPFTVALLRSRRAGDVAWALGALAGVVLITRAWDDGGLDLVGVALAVGAGACWGTYIVLTSKVGEVFEGFQGLAVSMSAAFLAVLPLGAGQAWHGLTTTPHLLSTLSAVAGLALLVPIAPYVLEMTALRRMPERVFSILMSLEPGMGAVAGLIILSQHLAVVQIVGLACVITASIAATLTDQPRGPTADAGSAAIS